MALVRGQRLVPLPHCRPASVWLPSVGRHLVCCRKQLQAHAQATENRIVEGVYSTLGRGINIDKTGSEQGVAVPSQWIVELLANVMFYEDIPNGFTPNFDMHEVCHRWQTQDHQDMPDLYTP